MKALIFMLILCLAILTGCQSTPPPSWHGGSSPEQFQRDSADCRMEMLKASGPMPYRAGLATASNYRQYQDEMFRACMESKGYTLGSAHPAALARRETNTFVTVWNISEATNSVQQLREAIEWCDAHPDGGELVKPSQRFQVSKSDVARIRTQAVKDFDWYLSK